ncbi:MAG: DUF4834 domain-containing protein [Bacteroidetes bacterium]|nr:DUF4834 domain-containing protein [Bacteroidota bacterium]
MVLLSITGLVKTIVYILVIYYGLKFLVRYVFPMLLKNYVDNKVGEMKKQQNAVYEQEVEQLKKQKGKVTISKDPSKDGEYVDYEEIV